MGRERQDENKFAEIHQQIGKPQMQFWLVVEPTHLKNISQIGSFPQVGMKIKKVC